MMDGLFRKKSISNILKDAEEGMGDGHAADNHLRKVLTVKDLTFFGIAAVIGTGVFTAIGSACFNGGPAVILLFSFTAIACAFAAYCYAEFSSTIPVSGSAYTYSYVAFGELFAWIIGWDLLMEYAIGNIAVAISWSQYFVQVLKGVGINLPEWITIDYATAHNGFNAATTALSKNQTLASLDDSIRTGYYAWLNAPQIGGFRLIMDIPALLIVVIITAVVYVGIRESKKANNIMVLIKLIIIILVIVAGAFYVHPGNWHPFMPKGFAGVMSGVSAVFFAYIGFDAISTTAEECKNPQRDLPKAMFNTLFICTALYIILVIVLTGMTSYTKLNVADPLAFVFKDQHSKLTNIFAGIISASAIIVIASVLLIYQLGQPRIWMSMSRDGLLPKVFSRIHPKYKTPSFSTIVTGFVVAIPALFLNLDVVIALTSIGTLFAFVLVCGGVLVLQNQKDRPKSKFKVPYINGRYIILLLVVGLIALFTNLDRSYLNQQCEVQTFSNEKKIVLINNSEFNIDNATVNYKQETNGKQNTMTYIFTHAKPGDTLSYQVPLAGSIADAALVENSAVSPEFKKETMGVHYFKRLFTTTKGLPMAVFWIVLMTIAFLTVKKNFSLIPVLGLLSCFYLMAQEGHTNWWRFIIWLAVGLVVYFAYGRRNSKLAVQKVN